VRFFACLQAGVVAVPVPSAARATAIAADCGARAVLEDRLTVLDGTAELADLACLLYTSGSTSAPKGVRLTHANLMGNMAAITSAARQGPDAVYVAWLPLFHDMGLLGMALHPVYAGAPCVLMPPRAFLHRPRRWLAAISRYRGTLSGGPDSAFAFTTRNADHTGLDLAAWRVAYCGAEPIHAATLEGFADRFAAAGFRRDALYPCYGLAEATAFFTGGSSGGIRRVGAHVACGHPHAGHRLRIVDAAGSTLPDGVEGEIQLAGPSVGQGYWGRPPFGEWLATGDLGYVDGGEVVVTGRTKDLIILGGRNVYPQDLERTARDAHPALADVDGAAFAGADGPVLVHELRPALAADAPAIARAVRRALAREHDVALADVAWIKAGSLPRTSSGKVRRAACASAYAAGTLVRL
jgi:acyl-CoA synthetase (AMP-forming)/AMP-acid ligase II